MGSLCLWAVPSGFGSLDTSISTAASNFPVSISSLLPGAYLSLGSLLVLLFPVSLLTKAS